MTIRCADLMAVLEPAPPTIEATGPSPLRAAYRAFYLWGEIKRRVFLGGVSGDVTWAGGISPPRKKVES